jgi:hypothetical protein
VHVAIEGEPLLRVGDADGDMVHTGWLHRSILPRILHSCMTSRIGTPRLAVRVHRPDLDACTRTATTEDLRTDADIFR